MTAAKRKRKPKITIKIQRTAAHIKNVVEGFLTVQKQVELVLNTYTE